MVLQIVTKCPFSFGEKHSFAKMCHAKGRGGRVVSNLTRQCNDKDVNPQTPHDTSMTKWVIPSQLQV